jgi:hypothetical protein
MKKQGKKTGTSRKSTRIKPAADLDKVTAEYLRENEEIMLAIEAMERAQLAQERRSKYLLEPHVYYIVGLFN